MKVYFLMDTYYTTFTLFFSHWCPHARPRHSLVKCFTYSHPVIAGAEQVISSCLLCCTCTLLFICFMSQTFSVIVMPFLLFLFDNSSGPHVYKTFRCTRNPSIV